jgi:cytochrome c peroxidase
MKYLIILLFLIIGCSAGMNNDVTVQDKALLVEAKDSFQAISKTLIDEKKNSDLIALGEKLYFETKLSANGKISCNSCHQLDKFGVDNEATSPGHDGRRGDRNSPTVYNAALNFSQFWDGRAKDLAAQAGGPILNPIEHGIKNKSQAMHKIKSKEYVHLFKKAFPSSKNSWGYTKLTQAIAAFEKTLLTPSRFDDFLGGNIKSLNRQERDGLKKFMEVGCTSCHNGKGIGGNSYQTIGAVNVYETKDLGRFNVTKDPEDKFSFKVPTLRNIVHTAPYFHDGSVKTIENAIKLMGFHQLDVRLSSSDIAQLKAFLGSLTAKKGTLYKKN